MKTEYQIAIEELNSNSGKVVSMAFVEWWLLKYGDLYRSRDWDLPYLDGMEGKEGKYAFHDAFYHLNELSQDHRFESSCKEAIESFSKLKSEDFSKDNTQLLNWILQHEKLGVQDVIHFGAGCYFPEDDLQSDFSIIKLNVKISRADFKHIISFLELFNKVYWTNHEEIAEMFPTSFAAELEKSRTNSVGVLVSGDTPPF
jgi:hypothetical protein